MAIDGITIYGLAKELNSSFKDGRISKISQPEPFELQFTIKTREKNGKILVSANPSLPFIYETTTNKTSPLNAPMFCMLLRKYIGSGKIEAIYSKDFERIITLEVSHLDELGDLCYKKIYVELMGKYSNIIFTDNNDKIIDSIKHIPFNVSSVREVLPGKDYFVPNTFNKISPENVDFNTFVTKIKEKNLPLEKAIFSSFNGISPVFAREILFRSGLSYDIFTFDLKELELIHLHNTFKNIIELIINENPCPCIYYDNEIPVDFSTINMEQFNNIYKKKSFNTISEMLISFYMEKNTKNLIKQKSSDMRQHIQTILSKDRKKISLWDKQLEDTKKADKYKVYGELLTTYGYNVEAGATKTACLNYYTNEEISIPLDKDLSAIDNAKKYFDKYNKLKRTKEAVTKQYEETMEEINHLESILTSIDLSENDEDLKEIKKEMIDSGYAKNQSKNSKAKASNGKNGPLHFVSSDGYDIFVGKNNIQNEYITFKLATGNDWWFHAKNMPGSHVIVKTKDGEIPDRTFEEAAALAAYYSKGRENPKVEIDYIQKKHVKKPNNGAKGFVVYYTNYSLMATPKKLL